MSNCVFHKGNWAHPNSITGRGVNLLLVLVLLVSCHPKTCEFEPNITYATPACLVESLPEAFPPLTDYEREQDWGKELLIATALARELDLYRAITAFKRADILIRTDTIAPRERQLQIEYGIVLSYYLGGKYWDAAEAFENSRLSSVCDTFPAYHDLLILLYEVYLETCQTDKALRILELIHSTDCALAEDLLLSSAVTSADLVLMENISENHRLKFAKYDWQYTMCLQEKSVKKAQLLNTFFPGAGYYYVGQKQAAITSFIINALFTAAAYQLFDRGYIAGGVIVSSLELGWYFGGINGAGLAAREWNEQLYNATGKDFLCKEKLFPILMFQTAF